MRRIGAALIALSTIVAAPAPAQEPAPDPISEPAGTQALEDFLWIARPLILFVENPNDPRYSEQLRMLAERADELKERDVLILTDADPGAKAPLRSKLHPRGFSLVLIDKDGSVVKRRPEPTTAREIIHLIDRLPSRRREIGSHRT